MAGKVPREVSRERERRAWELRQQLWTHERIAAELGVTHQAVTAMLKRVDRRVLAKLDAEVALQKAAQTAQLQYIADEAMQAWESCKSSGPDPRFLGEARGALSDLRKLWGLDAPAKSHVQAEGELVIKVEYDDINDSPSQAT